MARFYMHTIDGKPAGFSRRDGQIVFADQLPNWEDEPFAALLRRSVEEIERDQEITKRHRAAWGMRDSAAKYGYVIVRTPRQAKG